MDWSMLLALIAKEGLPLAMQLYDKWFKRKSEIPTPEEIAELNALANQTARTQMLAALQRAGIDPESAQGKLLLGLV